jgi:tape measure domain-containing protein
VATVSSTVELLIKAQQPQRALSALTQSTDKLKKRVDATQGAFARSGQQATSSAKSAGAAYDNLGTKVSGVNNIVRTLRNSFVALGGAVTTSGILQTGVDAIEAERKIKLLSMSSGDASEALDIAARAASRFGLSSTEANTGVARLLARLKPMGLSLEDIESTFAGFNIAAKLAGATASESSGAFLQLTQALGSGVLRGQELNSILEQAPLIATAIALEMNTTTGSLKKLGEEGKITSQIVLAALKRVESEGAEKLEEAMRGPAQQFINLKNQGIELAKVLTENVLPAIIPIVQSATDLLKSFNSLPSGIQAFIVSIGLAGTAVFALTKLVKVLAATKLAAFLSQQAALFQVFGAKIYFAAAAAGALKIALAALPFAAVTLGLGVFVNKIIEANRQQREFNELVNFGSEESLKAAIAKRIETREIIENTIAKLKNRKATMSMFGEDVKSAQILGLEQDLKNLDKEFAKISLKLMDLQSARRKLEAAKTVPEIKEDEDAKEENLKNKLARRSLEQLNNANDLIRARQQENQQLELQIEKGKEFADFTQRVRDLVEKGVPFSEAFELEDAIRKNENIIDQLEQQKQLYNEIAQTIEEGIKGAIMGAIDGTKSLSESLSGILRQLGGMFLSRGIGSFKSADGTGGSGLFGMFANGGRPPVGRPSIVGERGPELFVPDRAGTIIPNNQLGGSTSVVVNVDASGTEVQGNQGNADQLGRLIGQAVQAELIKQKRPGGLLTR